MKTNYSQLAHVVTP